MKFLEQIKDQIYKCKKKAVMGNMVLCALLIGSGIFTFFELKLIGIIIIVGGIALAVVDVRNLFQNPEYNRFIEEVNKIGKPEDIGKLLSSLKEHKNADGTLKFNNDILFYFYDTSLFIINIRDIKSINTEKPKGHSGKYHPVNLNLQNGTVSIKAHDQKAADTIRCDIETAAPHVTTKGN